MILVLFIGFFILMLSKSLISIVIFWEVGIYLKLVLDFNLVFFCIWFVKFVWNVI